MIVSAAERLTPRPRLIAARTTGTEFFRSAIQDCSPFVSICLVWSMGIQ